MYHSFSKDLLFATFDLKYLYLFREEASMSSLKTSQNGLLRRSSPKFPPAISHANDADSPKFSVALK